MRNCARRCSARRSFSSTTIVREDRSILDFIDADYTFVNETLAKHYGIAGVKGDEFRKVKLPDDRRGGILTQASVLTVTSNPTRTSPVKRGKWILENILGTPPPPPPPGVEELKEGARQELTGSLRQRMEQHRANPSCATCHQRMDPLGFGFENFDAIGGWRTKDGTSRHRPVRRAADGPGVQGTGGTAGDPETAAGRFRSLPDREDADLRPGPGIERLRPLCRGRHRKQSDNERLSVLRLVIEIVRAIRSRSEEPNGGADRDALATVAANRLARPGSGGRAAVAGSDVAALDLRRRMTAVKQAPLRMAFIYVPNGIHMSELDAAKGDGTAFELPPTLKPLEARPGRPARAHRLDAAQGDANGDGPGDHARAMARS